jgi:hypothetical protein
MLKVLGISAVGAALMAIGPSFVFRALAIVFNWKIVSLSDKLPGRQNR